ncbi:Flp pilus assembly complex ATPase component TadA [candidate division TA06 bacterium]|uniref:Flp pilus assembly complex ATPase component TadA n=1 Tax=candidate division TA06 bacterium TaxID=2250710 RepID=A0A933MKE2_UNCT6|nr:Flp pilus assembly complex ATPase component TadA [candidate division TA06 bacterium]
MALKLGDMLLQAGLITKEQLEKALVEQKSSGDKLGACLIKMKFITEEATTDFLGKQFKVPTINLSNTEIDPQVLKLIPADVAQKCQVIPVARQGRMLQVAISNPADVFTLENIQFLTGMEVKPFVCADTAIARVMEKLYANSAGLNEAMKAVQEEEGQVEFVDKEQEDVVTQADIEAAPVVKLVNGMIFDAVKRGVSDIHIEPYEKVLRVRFRIDGVLQEAMSPPKRIAAAVASRIKVLSRLNLTERRLPQDGRFSVKSGDQNVDFRVSTMPIKHGEKICIRILRQSGLSSDLTKLGLEGKPMENFLAAAAKPSGMILITGPTGSGKTNTLYSLINRLNTPKVNISTAEDPVEYDLMGINQVNIFPEIGYTFAVALKAFLRQDPNIILVGETRDRETGEIAMTAAMTGHLVLSTLHTNDAPSSLNRLLDMEIPPFLIAATVNVIEAQRLIRTICPSCKQPDPSMTPEMIAKLGADPAEFEGVTFYKGAGCMECNRTGMKGRIGLFEILVVTPAIRKLILSRASTDEIRAAAVSEGMTLLRQDGYNKVKKGITTLETVIAKTSSE